MFFPVEILIAPCGSGTQEWSGCSVCLFRPAGFCRPLGCPVLFWNFYGTVFSVKKRRRKGNDLRRLLILLFSRKLKAQIDKHCAVEKT